MAKTIGFVKLQSPQGGHAGILAYGTVAQIGTGGSFSVCLESAGSAVLRNTKVASLTQIGTVDVTDIQASGSSSGYVTVTINRGSFVTALAGGTIDLNFIVFGGGGSI